MRHGEAWVNAARILATNAHAGQVDKAGQPYIGHPERVAARFPAEDHNARIVGWLHDVVEDTDTTLADLLAAGFGPIITDAVDAISRRPRENTDTYYGRVRRNPLARRVKLADIADNTDPRRLLRLPAETVFRLLGKYAYALEVLDV